MQINNKFNRLCLIREGIFSRKEEGTVTPAAGQIESQAAKQSDGKVERDAVGEGKKHVVAEHSLTIPVQPSCWRCRAAILMRSSLCLWKLGGSFGVCCVT